MGGVKYGGDAEWQFIWNRFLQTQTPSEKSKLLVALTASTDVLILNRYWDCVAVFITDVSINPLVIWHCQHAKSLMYKIFCIITSLAIHLLSVSVHNYLESFVQKWKKLGFRFRVGGFWIVSGLGLFSNIAHSGIWPIDKLMQYSFKLIVIHAIISWWKNNKKAVLSQTWPRNAPTKINKQAKQPHLHLRSCDFRLTQFNQTLWT